LSARWRFPCPWPHRRWRWPPCSQSREPCWCSPRRWSCSPER